MRDGGAKGKGVGRIKSDERIGSDFRLSSQARRLVGAVRVAERMLQSIKAERAQLDQIERAAWEQRQQVVAELVQLLCREDGQ